MIQESTVKKAVKYSFWSILDHNGPYWTIIDLYGLFFLKTILKKKLGKNIFYRFGPLG